MKDLNFLSGKFFDFDVPKDKRYLLKYFKSDLQRAFLKYFMVFGTWENFCDHTGHVCSKRLLYSFECRFRRLVKLHQESKSALTEEGMELLGKIESGKLCLSRELKFNIQG